MNELEIMQVQWAESELELRSIRSTVFIQEQNVPESMEWEEEDKTCVHLLAKLDGEYIGTSRLLNTGQIGRMAVLKPYRKSGVGAAMLKRLLSIAEAMAMNTVFLNSQVDAIGFYEKFGFQVQGDVFDDAGIPHRKMYGVLATLKV